MPDKFPRKEKGDGLSHQHVNALSDVARMIVDQVDSTNPSPWQQHTFKIIDSSNVSGIFLGKIRYYSHSDSEWLERSREWDIDTNGLDLTVVVGDFLTAWWDGQRAMYIPIC